MGCQGIGGVLLITAATVLLLLVTLNVPLLKQLYFFRAVVEYEGTKELKLGTLGYCSTVGGTQECVGPQIGYNIDLQTILRIPSNLITIPSAIGKWMSYTLVLHIVAVCFGAAGAIVGALEFIPGFNMICFPTCLAGICASVTLVALVFDLVMFFLFKAAVGRASGGTGEVGAAVWMVLAAWLCASFAGCAYGMGRCCCGNSGGSGGGCGGNHREKRRERERDQELESYRRRDEEHRLDAIRDEQRRKKEQENSLPHFPEPERVPLNQNKQVDQYLYDDEPDPIPKVGAGYGRRDPAPSNQYYEYGYGQQRGGSQAPYDNASITTAGAAGLGAGPAGIIPTGNAYGRGRGGGGGYGGYGDGYSDPYQQPQQYQRQDSYRQDSYPQDPYYQDPYQQPQPNNYYHDPYSNNATSSYPPQNPGPVVAGAAAYNNGYNNQNLGPTRSNHTDPSTESTYANTGPYVTNSQTYQPYGHDGLNRDPTSTLVSTVSSESHYSRPPTTSPSLPSQRAPSVVQPVPQHLRTHQQSDLLQSPILEHPPNTIPVRTASPEAMPETLPPSYGHATAGSSTQYQPMEKGRPV